MPPQRSATPSNPMSASAQTQGQLIGVVFQIRDEYLQAHNIVFGNPITRLLRALRFQRGPSLRNVEASVAAQLDTLDATLPVLSRLPLSSRKVKDMIAYSWILRQAIYALGFLLEQSSASNRLSSASPAAMKKYRIAVEEFGRAGDRLRAQHLPKRRVALGTPPAETLPRPTAATEHRPVSPIQVGGEHIHPGTNDRPASCESSPKMDDETLGAAIHGLTYVLDLGNPAAIDLVMKGAPSLTRSRAHCELFCLRAFAALTVIRHEYEEPELELVTTSFYKEAHRIFELAGWRAHAIHVARRGDTYLLAFTTPLAPIEHEGLARAFLVGSEFRQHCQSSDDSLTETGANAFTATISSAERFIEAFRAA